MSIRAERVRSGELTFDAWARETMADWDRLATYLIRHFKVPSAVEVADIRNELLFHAWRYIPKWQPGGMPIDGYVIWCALSRTKRWLHKQRRARGCRDAGMYDLAFTDLGITEDLRTVEAGQEAVVERELTLDRIRVSFDSLRDRILVTAVWHLGSAEAAAEVVYAEPELRLACRFDSPRHARRATERAAELVREALKRERKEAVCQS